VDSQNQLQPGLAVFPFERTGERVAGNAVLVDVRNLEEAFGDIIERTQNNHIVLFEVPVRHSDVRVSSRLGLALAARR
jgi:hypothetical protein